MIAKLTHITWSMFVLFLGYNELAFMGSNHKHHWGASPYKRFIMVKPTDGICPVIAFQTTSSKNDTSIEVETRPVSSSNLT